MQEKAFAVDSYIRKKIDDEIFSRLKDQNNIVREIADKSEDILFKRLKNYGIILGVCAGICIGLLAFIGIVKFEDIYKEIDRRIQPAVKNAEADIESLSKKLDDVKNKIPSLTETLDKLGTDTAEQTRRVTERGGDLAQKLQNLQLETDKAQQLSEDYKTQLDGLSSKLESMSANLKQRVQEISQQVDDVTIRRAYPTLGQQKFVTYLGQPWKGKAEKRADEKWINIVIDYTALGDYTEQEIENISASLKDHGYTPIIGVFGVGGPTAVGDATINNLAGATVRYEKTDFKEEADVIRSLVQSVLSMPVLIEFDDLSRWSNYSSLFLDAKKLIVDDSGIDAVVILAPRKK